MNVKREKNREIIHSFIDYLENNNINKIANIFEKYRDMISEYVRGEYYSFTYDEINELTQETFYDILEKLKEGYFWAHSEALGWIIRIAQIKAMNYRMKNKTQRISYNDEIGLMNKYYNRDYI